MYLYIIADLLGMDVVEVDNEGCEPRVFDHFRQRQLHGPRVHQHPPYGGVVSYQRGIPVDVCITQL